MPKGFSPKLQEGQPATNEGWDLVNTPAPLPVTWITEARALCPFAELSSGMKPPSPTGQPAGEHALQCPPSCPSHLPHFLVLARGHHPSKPLISGGFLKISLWGEVGWRGGCQHPFSIKNQTEYFRHSNYSTPALQPKSRQRQKEATESDRRGYVPIKPFTYKMRPWTGIGLWAKP